MAWTAVKTWAVGDPMTAADMNTYVRDNLNFLANSNGDITPARHVVSSGTTPTIAAGAAAGTGPTISVAGNDITGTVTLTTGTATAGGASLFTVTFAAGFSAAPKGVLLFPVNGNAGGQTPTAGVYISTVTATTFTAGTVTALGVSTQFKWNYVVIG